jgi:hypothetical protein
MADFDPALTFALRHEDPALSGDVTTDNNGARVRFGLNEASNPDLGPLGFYEAPKEQALNIAKQVYARRYWNQANLSPLKDQRVASKVFDYCVNMGDYRAIIILQLALNKMGQSVETDGKCGQHTILAANAVNPDSLLQWLSLLAKDFHASLHERNPQKYTAQDLTAWIARDEELPPSA